MPDSNIILVGYSGHAFVVAEAIELRGMTMLGYTESSAKEFNPFQLTYLGYEDAEDFAFDASKSKFALGIGSNVVRMKVAATLKEKNATFHTVVHPDASFSKYSTIGQGGFVARNAAVNPLVTVGDFCILNTSCSVDHECEIGDGVHIAPGAVLAGNVKVGKGSFIGANSVIKEGVSIGENVIVGAGTVVTKNLEDGSKWVGNPARNIQFNK